MSIFEIRPHHGLCLHFFRGQGYSPAFVDNMNAITAILAQNPTIKLVPTTDCVCNPCPNRIGDTQCNWDDKVQRYDQSVLDFCGFAYGDELCWQVFAIGVEQTILSQDLRTQVCGDCQWSHLCR